MIANDPVFDALDALIAGLENPGKDKDKDKDIDIFIKQESVSSVSSVAQISLRARKAGEKNEEEKEGKGSRSYRGEARNGFNGRDQEQRIDNYRKQESVAEMRRHLDHGERVPRHLCAGCRGSIRPGEEFLELADDNRVHFPHGDDSYDCLIRHGERWRNAARQAVLMPADAQKPGPWPE
jgi:hypothetical protein